MKKLDALSKRNKKNYFIRDVVSAFFYFVVFAFVQNSHAQQNQAPVAIYSSLSEDLFLASFHIEHSNVLEFKFLGSQLSSRRFTRLMLQNATVNNGQELINQHVDAIEKFNRIIRVKGKYQRGDHLVFEGRDDALVVKFDGVELGHVQSPVLFNILLQSWIGEIPPSREFKDAVLGNTNQASTTREVFDGLSYSVYRQQQIESIVLARAEKLQANDVAVVAPLPIKTPEEKTVALAQGQSSTETLEQQKLQEEKLKAEKRALEKKRKEALEAARLAAQERKRLEESQRLLSEALLQQGREKFARELVRHTQKNIRYPVRSRKLNQTGNVTVVVTIDREGSLLEFSLEDKARYRALNEAVEKGVRRSAPFPEIPTLIEGKTFTFQVPIAFALQ